MAQRVEWLRRKLRRLWARLLETAHPRRQARAPDCRLSYLLEVPVGPLGVLSLVAAPLRLGPRDQYLVVCQGMIFG